MALTRITEGVIKPNENYVVNNINSSGVTTSTNFKTGTSNLHNVGIEIAGINVLGADTPIGTGATIYDAGGAVFTGVVTATSFSGSGNISADGNISGVDGTFTGNVSIGGTLTYEDVTNIDSVGLITARNGIDCNGDLDVDGHTNLDNVSIAGVTTFAGTAVNLETGNASTQMQLRFGTNAEKSRITVAGAVNDGYTGSTAGETVFNTNSQLTLAAGGSQALTISSARKVGIGTNNPGNTVHLGGTQGVGVRFHNYTSGNSAYLTLESGDKLQSNVGGTGYYNWVTGGGTKMTLTNAGVLGIGTAIPVGKSLESYNTGLSTPSLTWGAGNPGQRFVNEGSELKFGLTAYAPYALFIQANSSTNTHRQITLNPMGGSVAIGVTDPPTLSGLVARFDSTFAPSLTWNAAGGHIIRNEGSELNFGLSNASPHSFFIQGRTSGSTARQIVLNPLGGNIGVGTDNPSQRVTSYTASGYCFLANGPGSGIGLGNNGAIVFGTKDLGSYAKGVLDGTELEVKISGTAKVNITSGAITVADTHKVDIVGGIFGRALSDTFTLYSKVQPHYGFNLASSSGNPIGMSGYYGISFATEGSERFLIERNGRIFAKTDESTTGLIIQNTVHDSQLRIEASAANKNSIIQFADGADGDVGIIDYDHNDNSLSFTVNTSERLTINSSGVVQIDQGTSGGNHFKIVNDEISLLQGVNGTGDSYAREAFIGCTRMDSGSLPILRIAGQGGIKFCVDANSERLFINSAGVLQIKQTTNTNQGIEWYSAGGAKSASIGWGNGNANFEFKNFRQDAQADGPYGNVDFFTGSSTNPGLKLRIQVTGEIGTNGVTNPTALLHMGGTNNFIRLGTATLGGETKAIADIDGHPYLSGTPWYNTSTYDYDTSDSPHMDYYWIKIVESLGGSAIGYIEYMAHGDSNYPRSVHGFLDVAKYSNGSLSISHSQHSQQAGTVQCVVDSNEDIWLRFHGFDWNSDMRYRLVYGESVSMNSDFTVNGTSGNRIRNSEGGPPNMSYDIVPGATLRWNLSNSNPPKAQYGSTESQTAGTYGLNPSYATYSKRLGKVQCAGKIEGTAGWNDGGIYVTSNGIDVNGAQQPVTAIFRSQKNTVVEFNRMYTQGVMLQFKQNNDNRGYFNNSGTTTTYYDQGSDERLKTNFEEWSEEVLPHFKSLKPKKFNWIEDAAGTPKVKGFIAQENLDKFPEAYHLNEDDRYWFSKSEMVPYLMKALQEEIVKREEIEAKYNALEARIAALESS